MDQPLPQEQTPGKSQGGRLRNCMQSEKNRGFRENCFASPSVSSVLGNWSGGQAGPGGSASSSPSSYNLLGAMGGGGSMERDEQQQSTLWQRAQEHGNAALARAHEHGSFVVARAHEHGNAAWDRTKQQVHQQGRVAWQRAQEQGLAAWQKAPELRAAAIEAAQWSGETAYAHVGEYVRQLQELAAESKTLEEHKRDAKKALLKLTKEGQARVMLFLRESIKDGAVADPDMPECAQFRIRKVIDDLWLDLTACFELTLEDQRKALSWRGWDHSFFAGLGQTRYRGSPMWVRARLLYHWVPFDVSLFGQLKDPVYVVMLTLSMIALWGIRVAFCSVVLLCIVLGCPPDEYQLVGFILMFKGSQFISSGVVMSIIAAIQYYHCVQDDGTHTCNANGPGSSNHLFSAAIDVLGSCMLTWLAFLLLPFSERAAGTRGLKEDDDTDESTLETPRVCCAHYDVSKGGRISGLLCYDLGCLLFSVAFFFVLTAIKAPPLQANLSAGVGLQRIHANLVTWNFGTEILFARVVYALLSMPFLFFNLPVLNGILTHTVATGYNEQGLCVPYMLKPMPKTE